MVINGKEIAQKTLEKAKTKVENLKNAGVIPCLAVILAGNDPASRIYVNNKKAACRQVGINEKEYFLLEDTPQKELIGLIEKLNQDPNINGILVQLPLPSHIDEKVVTQAIDPAKDVDVFNYFNLGKVMTGNLDLAPCTPAGIMEIINYHGIEVAGKTCVVVGRSNIVGKPTALMMLQKNATVTICHSKTRGLKEICKTADILICAVGKPKFITCDMIKPGATVIDVGINRQNNGICGDVDFENVLPLTSYITPVPGGVGPLTVAMLIKNTIKAAETQNKKEIF